MKHLKLSNKRLTNIIYDIVRQITPFYLNTDDVYMKSGISYVDMYCSYG